MAAIATRDPCRSRRGLAEPRQIVWALQHKAFQVPKLEEIFKKQDTGIRELFMAEDDELFKHSDGRACDQFQATGHDETGFRSADALWLQGDIPITDEKDFILGVVPHRDLMNLKHRIQD